MIYLGRREMRRVLQAAQALDPLYESIRTRTTVVFGLRHPGIPPNNRCQRGNPSLSLLSTVYSARL